MALLFRSHWSQDELSSLRTDDVDGNHLPIINEQGRRDAVCRYGTNYKKYVPLYGGSEHTRLEIPILSGIDLLSPWSIFTWIYSDVPWTDNFILAKRTYNDMCFSLRVSDGYLKFETSGDGVLIDVSYLPKPTIQEPHFIGISFDPVTRQKNIYYDGVLHQNIAFHDVLHQNTAPFTLGSLSLGGRNIEGYTDLTGILPYEVSLSDWDFIWNNSIGRCYEEYFDNFYRTHNKVQFIRVGGLVPDEYIGIIPGSSEHLEVPGTSKEQPFNPPVSVPLPIGYTWIQPDEYTGTKGE